MKECKPWICLNLEFSSGYLPQPFARVGNGCTGRRRTWYRVILHDRFFLLVHPPCTTVCKGCHYCYQWRNKLLTTYNPPGLPLVAYKYMECICANVLWFWIAFQPFIFLLLLFRFFFFRGGVAGSREGV